MLTNAERRTCGCPETPAASREGVCHTCRLTCIDYAQERDIRSANTEATFARCRALQAERRRAEATSKLRSLTPEQRERVARRVAERRAERSRA